MNYFGSILRYGTFMASSRERRCRCAVTYVSDAARSYRDVSNLSRHHSRGAELRVCARVHARERCRVRARQARSARQLSLARLAFMLSQIRADTWDELIADEHTYQCADH